MTIEQRNEQIAQAMASSLYLPLKAARIRQIHDQFETEQILDIGANMTKEELDFKIDRINAGDDTPERKQERIGILEGVYQNTQTQAAATAESNRQAADERLKSSLKQAFMATGAASESDFEAAWPDLRLKALSNAALSDGDGHVKLRRQ